MTEFELTGGEITQARLEMNMTRLQLARTLGFTSHSDGRVREKVELWEKDKKECPQPTQRAIIALWHLDAYLREEATDNPPGGYDPEDLFETDEQE